MVGRLSAAVLLLYRDLRVRGAGRGVLIYMRYAARDATTHHHHHHHNHHDHHGVNVSGDRRWGNESADDVFAAVPSRRSHIQSADPVAGVMVMREREALGLIRVDTDTDADVDGTGMATAQWRHILAHSPLVQGLYHATFPNHEDEGSIPGRASVCP